MVTHYFTLFLNAPKLSSAHTNPSYQRTSSIILNSYVLIECFHIFICPSSNLRISFNFKLNRISVQHGGTFQYFLCYSTYISQALRSFSNNRIINTSSFYHNLISLSCPNQQCSLCNLWLCVLAEVVKGAVT